MPLVEVYPLTINLIRKGHKGKKKKSMASKETKFQAPTTMNWHVSSYDPFTPSLWWSLLSFSASLVNILGMSLTLLQEAKTGRFISILTLAFNDRQHDVLQLQLRLCFTEMSKLSMFMKANCKHHCGRPTLQRPHRNRKDEAAIGWKILQGFDPTSRAAWVIHVGRFDVSMWLSTIIRIIRQPPCIFC